MEMLIAILLWLGCIQAPNTYTTSVIDAYTLQNQTVINTVLADQVQQDIIWNHFGVAASEIDIINPYQ